MTLQPEGRALLIEHDYLPAVWTRRSILASSLAALFLTRPARSASEKNSWSIAAPLPFAVQEIYPVAFQERIVLAGGIVDNPSFGIGASARTIIYLPKEDAWVRGPDLPIALHHPGLLALPDRLLAIGGFVADRTGFWQMQSSVYSLDSHLEGWTIGPELPAPQAEFVSAYLGDKIVLVGGRRPAGSDNHAYGHHTDIHETWLLDPTTSKWYQGRPAPTARNSAAGAILDDKLHIVGGRRSTGGGIHNLDRHEVYDSASDEWSVRAPMPKAQGGLAAAALDGKLYAFGGEFFNAGSGVFEEAWVYDPFTDNWQAVAPMPVPRHGLGAVTLDDGIHVLGGATQAGADGRSERHDIFRPM